MGTGTVMLIFTAVALVGFTIISERVRYRLNKHWLERDPARRGGAPHH